MTTKRKVDQGKVPWEIITGVKNRRVVEITSNGSVVPLTGYSFYSQIRDAENGKLLADVDIAVTALEGKLELSVSAANSELIGSRGGVYDVLKVNDADATDIEFLFGGDVTLRAAHTEVS